MSEHWFSRARLIEILGNPDSPEREELLAPLTNDERRMLLYKLVQVPAMGRLDPNRIPAPPYSDAEMKRLATSATEKLMDIDLGRLLDEGQDA